jgi:hypothetical protein
MDYQQIISLVVSCLPSITAILGIIITVGKSNKDNKNTALQVMETFERVRQEIYNTKEYSELKSQLITVHNENVTLKRQINELLTKIDHIQRKDS